MCVCDISRRGVSFSSTVGPLSLYLSGAFLARLAGMQAVLRGPLCCAPIVLIGPLCCAVPAVLRGPAHGRTGPRARRAARPCASADHPPSCAPAVLRGPLCLQSHSHQGLSRETCNVVHYQTIGNRKIPFRDRSHRLSWRDQPFRVMISILERMFSKR